MIVFSLAMAILEYGKAMTWEKFPHFPVFFWQRPLHVTSILLQVFNLHNRNSYFWDSDINHKIQTSSHDFFFLYLSSFTNRNPFQVIPTRESQCTASPSSVSFAWRKNIKVQNTGDTIISFRGCPEISDAL